MRAPTWQRREDVCVESVPEPQLVDSTDAVIDDRDAGDLVGLFKQTESPH